MEESGSRDLRELRPIVKRTALDLDALPGANPKAKAPTLAAPKPPLLAANAATNKASYEGPASLLPSAPRAPVPALLKRWAGQTLPAAGLNLPPTRASGPVSAAAPQAPPAPLLPSALPHLPPLAADSSSSAVNLYDIDLSKLIPAHYVTWYRKVLEVTQVRGMPVPQSFVYLCPVKPIGSEIFDPFRLLIVGHDEVDPKNYYTLSSAGVTHYFDGQANFMSAEEFLAEFHMFLKIRHMPVFQTFYLWRAFKGWKTYVIQKKQREARQALEGRLFTSTALFQEGTVAVNHCCQLLRETWRPMEVSQEDPRDLAAFLVRQEALLEAALEDIEAFSGDVIGICEAVCQAVLGSVGHHPEDDPAPEGPSDLSDVSDLRLTLSSYLTSGFMKGVHARSAAGGEQSAGGAGGGKRRGSLVKEEGGRDPASAAADLYGLDPSAPRPLTVDTNASQLMTHSLRQAGLGGAADAEGGASGASGAAGGGGGGGPGAAASPPLARPMTNLDLKDTRTVYQKAMVRKTLRRYPKQSLTERIEERMAFFMRPDDWWRNSKDRKEKVARLGRFIRLADIMVQEALREVVETKIEAFSKFLDQYQPVGSHPLLTAAKSLKRGVSRGVSRVAFADESDAAPQGQDVRQASPAKGALPPTPPSPLASRPHTAASAAGVASAAPPQSDNQTGAEGGDPTAPPSPPPPPPFLVVELHLFTNFVDDVKRDGVGSLAYSFSRALSVASRGFPLAPASAASSFRGGLSRRSSRMSHDAGGVGGEGEMGGEGELGMVDPEDVDYSASLDFVPPPPSVVRRLVSFLARLGEAMRRARRVAAQRAFAPFFIQQARDAAQARALMSKRDENYLKLGIGVGVLGPPLPPPGVGGEEDEGGEGRRGGMGSLSEMQGEADQMHDFERKDYSDVLVESRVTPLLHEVEKKLVGAFGGLDVLKGNFVTEVEVFASNCKVTSSGLRHQYASQRLTLEGFEGLMEEFQGQVSYFASLPDHLDYRALRVSLRTLKGSLVPSPERCLRIIHELLPALAFEKYNTVISRVHHETRQLRSDLSSVDDFIAFIEGLARISAGYEDLAGEAEGVREMYRLLTVADIQVPPMQYAAYQTMANDFSFLKEAIDFADQKRDKLLSVFEAEIERDAQEVAVLTRELQGEAQAELIFHVGYVSPDPIRAQEEKERRRREEAMQRRAVDMAAVQTEKVRVGLSASPKRKPRKGGGNKKARGGKDAAAAAAGITDDGADPTAAGDDPPGAAAEEEEEAFPGSHGAPGEVLAFIDGLAGKITELRSRADRVRRYQRTFDLEQSQFLELSLLAEEVDLKRHMWASLEEVDAMVMECIDMPLDAVDAEDLGEKVSHLAMLVMRIERGLPPNQILPYLSQRVQIWSEIMPIISNLRNPDLRPRHWIKVEEIYGRKIQGDKTFTVRVLMTLKVPGARDAVVSFSTEATQEAQLEALLKKIQDRWSRLELIVKPYKELRDTYILGSCDHVTECLEDSQMTMMIVQSSKYAAGIRTEVDRVDRSLHLFSDTLEAWLECQRQWMYLETIFNAQDIQRQMPAETKSFFAVDRQFRDIMRKTRDRNNALQAGTSVGRLDIFQRCNTVMEKIIAKLETYLEGKRLSFPRFYLLSNDELVEILSQSRNPQAIQVHLQKCFEGIERLDFGQDPKSIDIFAMVSPEGESVSLGRNLKARGSVESWLGAVEQSMVQTLRKLGKAAYVKYPISEGTAAHVDRYRANERQLASDAIDRAQGRRPGGAPGGNNPGPNAPKKGAGIGSVMGMMAMKRQLNKARDVLATEAASKVPATAPPKAGAGKKAQDKAAAAAAAPQVQAAADLGEWTPQCPSQLAVLLSVVMWCQAIEGALIGLDPGGGLRSVLSEQQSRLSYLVRLIRTEGLDPLLRRTLVAMVTMDVHNRDTTEELCVNRCHAVDDFDWQMRLRAYYREDVGDVIMMQVAFKVPYGYEYLGAQTRLVQTPMTDRCYLTLTGALTLRLGGAPSGPAGTGKTETVKDLGKALGQPCVVFNCGDNLDHKVMGRFLSGIAQIGAWACFDEFNRIDIEVLSVVAKQLLTIQTALRAKATRFSFEGQDIPVVSTCGVFITMNPGYLGRTELPDNLKALFRPMSMITPDYGLVAEVVLFSEGFQSAKILSRKMVRLYKLSSEQLSRQDHYDFGMRALKSVLVMAGALNRSLPDVPEDLVLIKAIMDSNIPKLLSNDERLFRSIVSDLFPGTRLPEMGKGALAEAVRISCDELKLVAEPSFVEKVHHLSDTFGVRFGVMLVGPAGSGKTSIYRVLSHAVNYVADHPEMLESDAESDSEGGSSMSSHDSLPTPPDSPRSASMRALMGGRSSRLSAISFKSNTSRPSSRALSTRRIILGPEDSEEEEEEEHEGEESPEATLAPSDPPSAAPSGLQPEPIDVATPAPFNPFAQPRTPVLSTTPGGPVSLLQLMQQEIQQKTAVVAANRRGSITNPVSVVRPGMRQSLTLPPPPPGPAALGHTLPPLGARTPTPTMGMTPPATSQQGPGQPARITAAPVAGVSFSLPGPGNGPLPPAPQGHKNPVHRTSVVMFETATPERGAGRENSSAAESSSVNPGPEGHGEGREKGTKAASGVSFHLPKSGFGGVTPLARLRSTRTSTGAPIGGHHGGTVSTILSDDPRTRETGTTGISGPAGMSGASFNASLMSIDSPRAQSPNRLNFDAVSPGDAAPSDPSAPADGEPEEDQGPEPPMRVESFVLNPKSVKSAELFGEFNLVTDEWKDGLASGIIRAANLKKQMVVEGLGGGPNSSVMAQAGKSLRRASTFTGKAMASGDADAAPAPPPREPSQAEAPVGAELMRWIVFDGPVDSLWIENMNTVLDDNCMLCLPNGERIRLDGGSMRMLFEVHDLSAASPATISRCGMVYVPPDVLGWRPLVKTWLEHTIPNSALIEADPTASIAAAAQRATEGGASTTAPSAPGHPQPPASAGSTAPAPAPNPPKRPTLPGQTFRPTIGAGTLTRREGTALGGSGAPVSNPPGNTGQGSGGNQGGQGGAGANQAPVLAPAHTYRAAARVHPRLSDYIYKIFDAYTDPVLKYARKACVETIPSMDSSLVTAMTGIFQALLLRYQIDLDPPGVPDETPEEAPEEDDDPLARHKRVLLRIYVFALVWGVGGSLDSPSWDTFDEFIQDTFRGKVDFTGKGGVFDYYPDNRNECRMRRWDMTLQPFTCTPDMLAGPLARLLVPTVDTARFGFLLEHGLALGRHVFIGGGSGVGKSVAMSDTLKKMEALTGSPWMHQAYHLSGQTSCQVMQDTLESILVRKRRNKFGAQPGKRLILFLDDVNLAAKDPYGVQSAIELLRQVVDTCGMYDKRNWSWTWVEDVSLVAACAPPGGGRHPLTSRFLRHFVKLHMPPPSAASLEVIFGTVLRSFFDIYFTTKLRKALLEPIVHSSVEIYAEACSHLLPTPSKGHYTFNLRDLTRVFQGLLLVRPSDCPDKDSWVRLWVHEIQRAFSDRLIDQQDRLWLQDLLFGKVKQRFDSEDARDPKNLESKLILFGHFFKIGATGEDRAYREGPHGLEETVKLLVTYQDMHNTDLTLKAQGDLRLIFFRDTVEHISRVARALCLPHGHVMMVGLGGSGKRTVAQFASFLAGFRLQRIDLIRGYGRQEFREDLKKAFRVAGLTGKRVALLLSDSDIVDEVFLDDINSILTTGQMPGLFNREEREKIMAEIRPLALRKGFPDTVEGLHNFFGSRVESNLRIVLALSPAGERFRERVRQFPALTNNCVLDWFGEWPRDALHSVAEKVLKESFSTRSIYSFLESNKLLSLKIPFLTREALASLQGPAPIGASSNALLVPTAGKKHDTPLFKLLGALCVDFHEAVTATNARFTAETRRHYYITPKTYIDTLRLYITLLESSLRSTAASRDRLRGGIEKLRQTNTMVEQMRQELKELQPVLAERYEQNQLLIVEIANEQKEAEQIRTAVLKEENDAKELALQAQSLKDEAQADLDEAIPALEAAVEALNALNKQDIVEIKSFTKPPFLVQLTMEGVCILLGEAPSWDMAKKILNDPTFIKRLIEYDKDNIPDKVLKAVRRVTQDPLFTPNQVKSHSKAAMSMCMWVRAMETYAEILKVVIPKRLKLLEAEEAYNALDRQLKAKQEELQKATDAVQLMRENLAATEAELRSLQDQAELTKVRLQRAALLMSALGSESERWQVSADDYGIRARLLVGDVFLAAFFIGYLGPFNGPYRDALVHAWGERLRYHHVPCSDSFSLLGTMCDPRRLLEWSIQGLPRDKVSQENAVVVTKTDRYPLLIDPQGQAARWIRTMEASNGLTVVKASDPLLLRSLESAVRMGRPLLMEGVTSDSSNPLDPAVDPLLEKRVQRQGGKLLVRIGATMTELDESFRLYICTRDPNPHFAPEVCIKVTLVNFTVTREGLEEQLLAEVVRSERPDLEAVKERLTLQISSDKNQLEELESTILRMLEEAQGSILDNEPLIQTLNTSRTTALQVEARLREAEETEVQIEVSREIYRPVARRGSVLFFVISDLSSIEPMYQTSLTQFKALFNRCIEEAEKSEDVYQRLASLMKYSTEHIFNSTCRGLFEEHRLVFAFLLATQIQRADRRITDQEWDFLLRGAYSATAVEAAAGHGHSSDLSRLTPPTWIPRPAWDQILVLEKLGERFRGVAKSFVEDKSSLWRKLMEDPDPLVAPMPEDWGHHLLRHHHPAPPHPTHLHPSGAASVPGSAMVSLDASLPTVNTEDSAVAPRLNVNVSEGAVLGQEVSGVASVAASPGGDQQQQHAAPEREESMQLPIIPSHTSIDQLFVRLMLIKVLREEEFVRATAAYVSLTMGSAFTLDSTYKLSDVLSESQPGMPVLFLLAQGTDPTASLQKFADRHGRTPGEGLTIISLGKGQGPIAAAAIREASLSGGWVILLNCHLAMSWMPSLEATIEDLQQRERFTKDAESAAAAAATQDKLLFGDNAGSLISGTAEARPRTPESPMAGGGQQGQGGAGTFEDDDIAMAHRAVHGDFRIWLTSMPAPGFPTVVLQSSLKIAMERPKGIRSDVLNILKDVDPESMELVLPAKGTGGNKRMSQATPPGIAPLLEVHVEQQTKGRASMSNRQLLMMGSMVGRGLGQEPSDTELSDDAKARGPKVSAMTTILWGRLVFALAAFHAVALERRKFGPLGWNVYYEFGQGDFECSLNTLRSLVTLKPESGEAEVQWKAVRYMVGDISYGGRVTDEHDRHLLQCVLRRYLSEETVLPGARHGNRGLRRGGVPIPEMDAFKAAIAEQDKPSRNRKPMIHAILTDHARSLGEADGPEIFGLSRNADISYRVGECKKLIDVLLVVQPRSFAPPSHPGEKPSAEDSATGAAGGASSEGDKQQAPPEPVAVPIHNTRDELVVRMATEILRELPLASLLSLDMAQKDHPNFRPLPSGHDNSLGTVLQQESQLFTRLLRTMRTSLEDLQKAVRGTVLMSKELEAMYVSILNNQVPAIWARAAYPSLKPLGSWVSNLQERVIFISKWITGGEPHVFWMAALFFPQGFLTALLQNHSRRNQIAIDRLVFAFRMMGGARGGAGGGTRSDVAEVSRVSEGALVAGLYLEGAKLHNTSGVLVQCGPGEMVEPLPIIHFLPQAEEAAGVGDGSLDDPSGGQGQSGQSLQHGPGPTQRAGAGDGLLISSPNVYRCPLYRTRLRAGGPAMVAGQSAHYILDLAMPIQDGSDAEDWTLQAVAALCELDD